MDDFACIQRVAYPSIDPCGDKAPHLCHYTEGTSEPPHGKAIDGHSENGEQDPSDVQNEVKMKLCPGGDKIGSDNVKENDTEGKGPLLEAGGTMCRLAADDVAEYGKGHEGKDEKVVDGVKGDE